MKAEGRMAELDASTGSARLSQMVVIDRRVGLTYPQPFPPSSVFSPKKRSLRSGRWEGSLLRDVFGFSPFRGRVPERSEW